MQRIAHVGNGGTPLKLAANAPFSFRIGLSIAPNRHPHPRGPELRHFTWAGDDRYTRVGSKLSVEGVFG
jgi:hypothetical protein